jgi:hypothetical protein
LHYFVPDPLGEPITKITSLGVRRAIDQYRGDLTQGLLQIHHERLAAIARGELNSQEFDEPMLQLLRRRIAFEYSNDRERWVDIHPLVIETEGFRRAYTSGADLADA